MSNTNINIFLADDHSIFREGIRSLFDDNTQMTVIGEAADGSEIIENLEGIAVNVLLLDIEMPKINGLDIIDKIIDKYPAIQILVFSMHSNEEYIHQMLNKGTKGYLLKTCNKDELFRAIKTVNSGDSYLSEEVSIKLLQYISINKKRLQQKTESPLTNRELEVLKLVATGLTNQVIGKQLNISHRTVDTHRRNIKEKLNLHNGVALANYVQEKGL